MGTIDLEVAESEFDRFIEMNAILVEENSSNEDKEGFQLQKSRILKAMVSGHLVINENGEPVYTPCRVKDSSPLTFHEPTGASLMAMDRKAKGKDVAKLYATMADMTKTNSATFSNMKMADLQVCMAITTLFLA